MKLLLKDNGKTYNYFDKFGLMLERLGWGFDGKGDALWRTSLAYIAWPCEEIKEAMLKLTEVINGKLMIYRHPTIKKQSTSRDQAIMLVASLVINGDLKELAYIRKHATFLINGNLTASWLLHWFWLKGHYNIWGFLLNLSVTVKKQPDYAIHLLCWMIFVSGQKVPRLRKKLLNRIPESNYLLRELLGIDTGVDVNSLKSYSDFIWQRDVNNFDGHELTAEQSEYNDPANDVLRRVIKIKRNKSSKQ